MPQSKVLIAICTYNRNESLELLIGDLHRQEGVFYRPTVLIVDNSMDRAAETLIRESAKSSYLLLEYAHEAREGVAHARNMALTIAEKRGSALIFVDDDQRLDKFWLQSLLDASSVHAESIIVGPVTPIVDLVESDWCPNALCWQRPTYADNQQILSPVGTGNILIPFFAIQRNGRFRPDLNSGGEDTEYSMRWIRSGGSIYYCKRALSTEMVVRDRLSPRYVSERTARSTCNWAIIYSRSRRSRFGVLLRLPVYFLQGCVKVITHPHKGNYFDHARIYFGKFIGLSRFTFGSKLPSHLYKISRRKC
jgi:glycosyltransferase involved in cell wall biosynthesis